MRSETSRLYIGLICGTSMDGVDAALLDIDEHGCKLLATHMEPLPATLAKELKHFRRADANISLEQFGRLDRRVGHLFAQAALRLLTFSKCSAKDVAAIGSHGQTLRHNSKDAPTFSLQIGDPNTIAVQTGIKTVADFRRVDVARDGQGAPLAPLFHDFLVRQRDSDVAIINLGGIANVTVLHADGQIQGFDTGPANSLMDYCVLAETGDACDTDGKLAAVGQVADTSLQALLQDPYFAAMPPKSTGFEDFNVQWLERMGGDGFAALSISDKLATLAQLSAQTIASAIRRVATPSRIYLCGGGVHNPVLVRDIQEALAPAEVSSIDELGIGSDWIEAAAFAWLAHQRIHQQDLALAGVTGGRNGTLGGVYLP